MKNAILILFQVMGIVSMYLWVMLLMLACVVGSARWALDTIINN